MSMHEHEVWVAQDASVVLHGCLTVPEYPRAVVVFAQPSCNGRHEPQTRVLTGVLADAGLATLVVDLLTEDEEDERHGNGFGRSRHDLDLLVRRLINTSRWLPQLHLTRGLGVGYYGAGIAGAAALIAASCEPHRIGAVVTRGGRLDLLDDEQLSAIWAPTLLLAPRDDLGLLTHSRTAMERMVTDKHLALLPGGDSPAAQGATLEFLAGMTREWFLRHLATAEQPWAPPGQPPVAAPGEPRSGRQIIPPGAPTRRRSVLSADPLVEVGQVARSALGSSPSVGQAADQPDQLTDHRQGPPSSPRAPCRRPVLDAAGDDVGALAAARVWAWSLAGHVDAIRSPATGGRWRPRGRSSRAGPSSSRPDSPLAVGALRASTRADSSLWSRCSARVQHGSPVPRGRWRSSMAK
jgi:dienelactone hydrolase